MPSISWDVSCPTARLATVTQASPTNGPFGPGFGISFSGNAIGASPIAWTVLTRNQTHQPASWSTNIREDISDPYGQASAIFYDTKPPIIRTATVRLDYNLPYKNNSAVTTQTPQPTVGLMGVAIGNPLFGDTFVGPMLISWVTNSVRGDNSVPQSRSGTVRQDTASPMMWTLNVINIATDYLSPIAWNSISLRDAITPLSISSTMREDILTRHQILNSQVRDVVAPVSSSALTRADQIVPESWISGLIREDGILPISWLYDVRRDLISPFAWVSQLIQVAWDANIPVAWGGAGIRSDIVSGLAYTSTVRLDFIAPEAYRSSAIYDILPPVEQRQISRQDINTPVALSAAIRQDDVVWLSWNGSTFPLGNDDYNVPMAWGITAKTDINVPVAWAGGVNPIQGDWLSPLGWNASGSQDIKPPVAAGVGIIRDVLIPETWRLTVSWDALEPMAWGATASGDALSPVKLLATTRVDYVARIAWTGVSVSISYDALSPIAWGAAVASDKHVPVASGTVVVRLDGLVPFKTSSAFREDVSAPDSWSAKISEDTLAALITAVGIREDYVVRLGWVTSIYNVAYDLNIPISWSSVWSFDLDAPAVSASGVIRRDVVAPVANVAGVVNDAVVPVAIVAGVASDVNVPFAWSTLSGIATYYDVSSPMSWGTAGVTDWNSGIGYAVALTEDALVPVEWDGKPFTPDPERTVYGPGGVRIAIP